MSMKRVGWESGTLKAKGYVEIDGVKHDIVMPEYEGNTPITPNNLKAMEDNAEEYIEDRVPILVAGTTLYSSTDGTTGNIELSDSIKNYNYFSIEYYNIFTDGTRAYQNSGKLPTSNTARIHLSNSYVDSNYALMFYNKRISISEVNLTAVADRLYYSNGSSGAANTYITKVIGYKY